jgi:hypothetical protein
MGRGGPQTAQAYGAGAAAADMRYGGPSAAAPYASGAVAGGQLPIVVTIPPQSQQPTGVPHNAGGFSPAGPTPHPALAHQANRATAQARDAAARLSAGGGQPQSPSGGVGSLTRSVGALNLAAAAGNAGPVQFADDGKADAKAGDPPVKMSVRVLVRSISKNFLQRMPPSPLLASSLLPQPSPSPPTLFCDNSEWCGVCAPFPVNGCGRAGGAGDVGPSVGSGRRNG